MNAVRSIDTVASTWSEAGAILGNLRSAAQGTEASLAAEPGSGRLQPNRRQRRHQCRRRERVRYGVARELVLGWRSRAPTGEI